MKAINSTRGKELAGNLGRVESLGRRLKGLLGRHSLATDEGVLLKPCWGVHTFGMKFPIDLVFLSSANRVIAVCKEVPPNRIPPVYLGTRSVLELPAGRITETATGTGDLIIMESQESD